MPPAGAGAVATRCDGHVGDHNICYDLTPPGPAVDPTPTHLRGPISAVVGIIWQNGRTTNAMRAAWAAGARGAAAQRCPDCTAPLVWNRAIGGRLVCWGCTHSGLPLKFRRRLVELWLTGIKASDIAAQLGTTKCAVLGYRTRARLPLRGSPLQGCPDSRAAKRRRRAIEKPAHIPPKKATPLPAPKPVAPLPSRRAKGEPAVPGGAALVAENEGRSKGTPRHAPRHGFVTCQYLVGRRAFCDDPVAELSPYCPTHTALCFQARAA
jgi:hypothetical protein